MNSIALVKHALQKLSLVISVDKIVYPHSDDQYSLFLFTSNSHPLLNTTINHIELSKPVKKELVVTNKPLPAYLHLWLFVTCKDSDQILTQTPLGMARILFSDLNHQIEFKDIEGGLQAVGTVQCLNTLTNFQKPVPDTLSQYYIEKVWAAYDKMNYKHEQRFSYIETHMVMIPLLAFPILATMIKTSEEQAAQLFLRLLTVAKQIVSDKDEYELIGEMLTLISRCLMYQPDTVRISEEKTRGVDQWSSLGCFPSLSVAGFDCEDGAKQILELFYLFKSTKLPGSKQYE
jgi:hypothetical protein